MREAKDNALVVVCTLVDPAQKEVMAKLSRELGVEVIDPVLPVISRLSSLMDQQPEGRPWPGTGHGRGILPDGLKQRWNSQ